MSDWDLWKCHGNKRKRRLTSTGTVCPLTRTMKGTSLSREVETVCVGAGDLEFYRTETGTLGVEDSVCRSILLQPQSWKYQKYISLLIRRFPDPNTPKMLLLACQFSCSEILGSSEALRSLTPHLWPSTPPGMGF